MRSRLQMWNELSVWEKWILLNLLNRIEEMCSKLLSSLGDPLRDLLYSLYWRDDMGSLCDAPRSHQDGSSYESIQCASHEPIISFQKYLIYPRSNEWSYAWALQNDAKYDGMWNIWRRKGYSYDGSYGYEYDANGANARRQNRRWTWPSLHRRYDSTSSGSSRYGSLSHRSKTFRTSENGAGYHRCSVQRNRSNEKMASWVGIHKIKTPNGCFYFVCYFYYTSFRILSPISSTLSNSTTSPATARNCSCPSHRLITSIMGSHISTARSSSMIIPLLSESDWI